MLSEKRCTKCGEVKPVAEFSRCKRNKDGLGPWCKQCASEYRRNDKERIDKYNSKYYQEHKHIWTEYGAEYRINNKGRIAERGSEHYRKNKGRIAKRHAEYGRQYRQTMHGKDIMRKNKHVSRARRAALVSDLTNEQWCETLDEFGNRCAYCNAAETLFYVLEQEHFIPIKQRGGYTKGNIIPACRSCNASKHDRDYFEWIKTRKGKRNPALAGWIARYHPELSSEVRREQGAFQAGKLV